jgi:hypothetical protein
MARLRSIDPEVWKHPAFLRAPWHCREVFMYLFSCAADDEGRFLWDPLAILEGAFPRAYPVSEDDVIADLDALKNCGLVYLNAEGSWAVAPPFDRCCRPDHHHDAFSDFVKMRDRQCLRCGSTRALHAHHIIPKSVAPRLRDDASNGITLCASCHKAIRGRELEVAGELRVLLGGGIR